MSTDHPRTHQLSAMPRLFTGGRPRPARSESKQRKRSGRKRAVHPALRIVRIVAGWILIVLGIIGIVMPLMPAVVLIPAGVVLVGRDSFLIRLARVFGKLFLRKAETWSGWLGRLGHWARDAERRFAQKMRDRRVRRHLKRAGAGKPEASSA